MSILSLFVLIPALMLLGLWLSRNLYQVRGVMVTGASLLLALSVYLTIDFIQQRHGGNTDPCVKAIYDSRAEAGLDAEQLRVVEETYKGFVKAGAQLSDADKETLK